MVLLRSLPKPFVGNSARPTPSALGSLYGTSRMSHSTRLVVGDGDLSYSASIAEKVGRNGVRLVATVLESKDVHHRVYLNSEKNMKKIVNSSMNHEVRFGVDATKLESFDWSSLAGDDRIVNYGSAIRNEKWKVAANNEAFDVIDFNFPHWGGKTNNRYNRQLVDQFLLSASRVLKQKSSSEIRIALCTGQGGMPSTETIDTWRVSWMPAVYAAEHGLLLKTINEPYEPAYALSSHRNIDRPFHIGEQPQQYIFGFPENVTVGADSIDAVPKHVRVCCRHELRIRLDPDRLLSPSCPIKSEDIISGGAVRDLAKRFVPTGIDFEIPSFNLLEPYRLDCGHVPLAVFLLAYTGTHIPLTRSKANEIRANIETAVQSEWNLEVGRPDRMVSRLFPYTLLQTLIRDYSGYEKRESGSEAIIKGVNASSKANT